MALILLLQLKYSELLSTERTKLAKMGPKFKATDGKEFDTRAEWRDYMMATFYSFKNKKDVAEPLIKKPGEIAGQVFDIADCEGCTMVIMDNCEQVQIDNVKNSRIFIGACHSSIFIRNCTNCVFYTACRQLRLREVVDSKFYIYSMSEVHIEYSNAVQFAPFNGGYPEQADHLKAAKLDATQNLWYDIFDHNDAAKTREHWSLIPEGEYEAPWWPVGECTPAVPRTKAGSVVRVEDNSMQSFNAQQLAAGVPGAPPASSSPTKKTAAATTAAAANSSAAAAPAGEQPPAPPSAAATKVVPPLPPAAGAVPIKTDAERILECATAFGNFKAGDSMAFGIPELSIVLSSGLNTTLGEIAQEHCSREFWHIENISISSSKDMAWAVFWINIAGLSVSRHTAVFMNTAPKGAESNWQMAHVQGSSITALAELEVPKKTTL